MSDDDVLNLIKVDILEFEQGDVAVKEIIKNKLKCSLKEHGFFSLSGHGISNNKIDNVLNVEKRFFELSNKIKKNYGREKYLGSSLTRGYDEKQFEMVNSFLENAALDSNEVFMVGRNFTMLQVAKMIESGFITDEEVNEVYLENIWPKEIPEMEQVISSYFENMYSLSLRIRNLIEYILGFKIPSLSLIAPELTLSYYPRITEKVDRNQWRIAQHEDHNMFTILLPCREEGKLSDTYGRKGLELLYNNKWLRAIYDNDVFIINAGHTLKYISNGKCTSSLHRVSMPLPSKTYDNSRISVAYNAHAEYKYHKHTMHVLEELTKKGHAVY